MSKSKRKFLPCPFCGGQPNLQISYAIPEDSEDMYFMECISCGTNGPYEYSEEEAMNSWENREEREN